MKVNIKTNDINFNVIIPNGLLLNKITFHLISKKIKLDIEHDRINIIFKALKKYLKVHPHFDFLEIVSDETIFKISS